MNSSIFFNTYSNEDEALKNFQDIFSTGSGNITFIAHCQNGKHFKLKCSYEKTMKSVQKIEKRIFSHQIVELSWIKKQLKSEKKQIKITIISTKENAFSLQQKLSNLNIPIHCIDYKNSFFNIVIA